MVYAETRTFIVTCLLCSFLTNQWQRFRKVIAIRHLINWIIQELLLVDLAKKNYTRAKTLAQTLDNIDNEYIIYIEYIYIYIYYSRKMNFY